MWDFTADALFDLLRGVTQAVVVVVEHGSGEDVDSVVFVGVASQQRPLQVAPHPCKHSDTLSDSVCADESRTVTLDHLIN